MTTYLPRCCFIRPNGAGGYEVGHDVKDPHCRHETDNVRRIIGKGSTQTEARIDARETLAAAYGDE